MGVKAGGNEARLQMKRRNAGTEQGEKLDEESSSSTWMIRVTLLIEDISKGR